jgi:hypothetical protein
MAPLTARRQRSPAAGPGRRILAELHRPTLIPTLIQFLLRFVVTSGHSPRDHPS